MNTHKKMVKNAQIHIRLKTEWLKKLQEEAESLGITISDLCRQKIKTPPQIMKIEEQIEKIYKILEQTTKNN